MKWWEQLGTGQSPPATRRGSVSMYEEVYRDWEPNDDHHANWTRVREFDPRTGRPIG
jgi:hypothetical protein